MNPEHARALIDESQYTGENIDHYEIIFGNVSSSQSYTLKDLCITCIFNEIFPESGEKMLERFANMLDLKEGDKVLDFGSGLGGGAFFLASKYNASVLGIDVSKNMIDRANRYLESSNVNLNDKVRFELCDGTRQEFWHQMAPPETFSAIISREVIVHLNKEEKATLFQRFHKSLKPGGNILIVDYCLGSDASSDDFQKYISSRNYFMIPMPEYKILLEKEGFSNVEAHDLTKTCIEILEADVKKLVDNKQELLSKLSPQDYNKILEGWKKKLDRCKCGNQSWGLFLAKK